MNNNKTQNQNDNRSEQEANLALMEARVKKLTTRLRAGLFLLFAMLIAGALFFANVYYERLALALTGNYTMTSGDLLTAGDWNTLANDFVDKSGDTMSGNLTAPDVCTTAGKCLSENLSCVTVENSCNATSCTATCDSGTFVTGGGWNTYWGTNMDSSRPDGNNGWFVGDSDWAEGQGPLTVYAVCCQIQ